MPLIKIDEKISKIVPQRHLDLLEKSEITTKKIVDFVNKTTDEYGDAGVSLAFATLYYIRTVENEDPEIGAEMREAILEIISESR